MKTSLLQSQPTARKMARVPSAPRTPPNPELDALLAAILAVLNRACAAPNKKAA